MAVRRSHQRGLTRPQPWAQNLESSPVSYAPTTRQDVKRVATTAFAGRHEPLAFIPLLREDRLQMSRFRFNFEMAETTSMLLNAVRCQVQAHYVSRLAMAKYRDKGRDSLDRSYAGIADPDGSTIPWHNNVTWQTTPGDYSTIPHFFKQAGLHGDPVTGQMNDDYVESFNLVWNYLAKQASPNITERGRIAVAPAPAFWNRNAMRHVKPTFDDALIDGRVPIAFEGGSDRMDVYGITTAAATNGDAAVISEYSNGMGITNAAGTGGLFVDQQDGTDIADIYTLLGDVNGSFSLANIELARQTAAYARIRTRYQGIDEEHIIDQLMAGIRVPEQVLREPIPLGSAETIIGMSQRYATDSDNLDKSATNGLGAVEMMVGTPRQDTGGVVVFTYQILPEQLYERQKDYYLFNKNGSDYPSRMADELDPQPVSVVTNAHVDTAHGDPEGVFGYAPLNHEWQRDIPNLGGDYYRPDPQAGWTEYRNRVWAVEQVDPQLTEDFYISSAVHHEVFADSGTPPFEISMNGVANIEGLTFFGPALRESNGDYDAVLEQVDQTRIVPPAPTATETSADDCPPEEKPEPATPKRKRKTAKKS
jgi:hypothetical protein